MSEFDLGEKLHLHLQYVKKYLVKMGANTQDAEDVIQDTAYKFLSYIDSIPVKNVESWLFRVAINQYYDLCRQRTRRNNVDLRFEIQELFEEFTPEKALLQKELQSDIYTILDRLKPKHSQFLLLKYSTGLKLAEIAEVYDMKVDSVKTIIHRARKQFIKEYRRYEKDE